MNHDVVNASVNLNDISQKKILQPTMSKNRPDFFFISGKKSLDKVQNVSQFKKINFDVVLVNSLSTMNFELSVL